jgi:hypothetical protein
MIGGWIPPALSLRVRRCNTLGVGSACCCSRRHSSKASPTAPSR